MGGRSGNIPTIDVRNHRTPGRKGITKFKFRFVGDDGCGPVPEPLPGPVPIDEPENEPEPQPGWEWELPDIPFFIPIPWLDPSQQGA